MRVRNTKNGRRLRRRTGFTLVEIMVVVFIIAVLLNIAAPGFLHARDAGWQRSCASNLHNISLAKEQYAIDNNISDSETYSLSWNQLSPYIQTNTEPLCPATGQVYNIGNINEDPTCPYGGPPGLPHTLQLQ